MRGRNGLILMMALLAAVAIGACGNDDDGDDGDDGATTEASTETAAGAGKLTVKMGDFFFDPKDVSANAGSVTISAPNVGEVEHELVLFKSDADPASLPLSGSEVDEEALEEQGGEEAGEIEEVAPGETKEKGFELTAGKYVMFCNLPGHYKKGMYGGLTAN